MATFGTSAGGGDTGMPADAPTAAAATAHAASTAALAAPMASTTTEAPAPATGTAQRSAGISQHELTTMFWMHIFAFGPGFPV